MKKRDKEPQPPDVEDIEAFEEWEEASSGGSPKEVPDVEEEQIEEPPKQVEKPKEAKATKIETPIHEEILNMSADVPVHLVAVIGRTTISVKDLMSYQMGQVIDLGRPPGETVDLVASGKLFARGELVDIDGKLGVRIVKLVR